MSPFLRQWQAQGADCQSGEWCWIGKLVSAASAGRWSAYWLSQTEKGELSKRSLTSDKGATNCICRLFLQRGFTPKKRRDLSIVRHALFRVQSRRKYEGPFSKPWSQPWGYSNEVLFLRVVCTLLSVWRSSKPKGLLVCPFANTKEGNLCGENHSCCTLNPAPLFLDYILWSAKDAFPSRTEWAIP